MASSGTIEHSSEVGGRRRYTGDRHAPGAPDELQVACLCRGDPASVDRDGAAIRRAGGGAGLSSRPTLWSGPLSRMSKTKRISSAWQAPRRPPNASSTGAPRPPYHPVAGSPHALLAKVAGGCHLSRPIDHPLCGAGFEIQEMERGYVPGPRVGAHLFPGLAARRRPAGRQSRRGRRGSEGTPPCVSAPCGGRARCPR
jgi:hypothetical protein